MQELLNSMAVFSDASHIASKYGVKKQYSWATPRQKGSVRLPFNEKRAQVNLRPIL
jgi:hypothetical protein